LGLYLESSIDICGSFEVLSVKNNSNAQKTILHKNAGQWCMGGRQFFFRDSIDWKLLTTFQGIRLV
jgi:hypothetical protein